jgi:hypothetical protein
MAESSLRCMKRRPRGRSPEEKSSSMVDFVGEVGFDGSVLSSSILDTDPIGWRIYLQHKSLEGI